MKNKALPLIFMTAEALAASSGYADKPYAPFREEKVKELQKSTGKHFVRRLIAQVKPQTNRYE